MIGIIIITHGNLATEFKNTAQMIMGNIENIEAIDFLKKESVETLETKLKEKIAKFKDAEGIIIFTDIFGGSCLNVAASFLGHKSVEIIAGINLPLLLETINLRAVMPYEKLIEKLKDIQPSLVVFAKDKLKHSGC